MGAKFILPNADFSDNAIAFPVDELKSSMNNNIIIGIGLSATLVGGGYYTLETIQNMPNRAFVWGVDLSPYFHDGCSNIELIANDDFQIILCLGASFQNVAVLDDAGDMTNWRWMENCQGEILENSKLFIHIRKKDNSDLPSNLSIMDALSKVILR